MNYCIITPENRGAVGNLLERQGGMILICEKGPRSYYKQIVDARFGLFDKPRIVDDTIRASKNNYRAKYSREYRLNQVRERKEGDIYSDLAETFAKLELGDSYFFQIAGQFLCSRGLCEQGNLAIYIPSLEDFEPAFRFALQRMTEKINQSLKISGKKFEFSQEHQDKIVEYAIADLRSREILCMNIGAGEAADSILGM